jgi:hypothetical protein
MPRHFMQTAGNSGVANLLVQAILDDLAARALKTIDAVIETLPGGFPGAVADSVRRGVSERLRLLDAGTKAEDTPPKAASLLIDRQNLVCQAQLARFVANTVSKAIVPPRPSPFFQPFLAPACLASVKLLLSRCGPFGVLYGPSLFQRP